jgi:hypothetical protein
MMNVKNVVARRAGAALNAWRTFWFRPEPAYTLGIVRIAFGGLLIVWTLWMYQGLYASLGPKGITPRPPNREYVWGVFHLFPSQTALLVGWLVLLAAAVALTVGWHSRIAAVLVFIVIMSMERRNPSIFNGGDALLRIESIFIMLAPCGAALSLDQRRRSGSFWTAQAIRPWALRLLQIQLSIVYLATVVEKLSGDTWHNGTAVMYALHQNDLHALPMPSWFTDNLLLTNALTWGTLVIEVALGILVWNRRCRPWVLGAGVIMHLSISLMIQVGFFTWVTFILYLAFIPPERAEMLVKGAQRRLTELVSRLRRNNKDEDIDSAAVEERPKTAVLNDADSHRVGTGWPPAADMSPDPSEPTPEPVSPERISAALEAAHLGAETAPDPVARAHRLATPPERGRHRPAPAPASADPATTGRHGPSRHAMR